MCKYNGFEDDNVMMLVPIYGRDRDRTTDTESYNCVYSYLKLLSENEQMGKK